jgi:hypothetical protein
MRWGAYDARPESTGPVAWRRQMCSWRRPARRRKCARGCRPSTRWWGLIVDEQLLAGAVDLAHRSLELLGEAPVVFAELRVAVGLAIGVIGTVFFPQQHQRHALAAQFLMQAAVVRLNMVPWALRRNQQAPLERRFVGALYSRPVQAGGSGQAKLFGDGGLRQAQRGGDLPVRQVRVQLQTQYIFNLTHIDPRCRHAVSSQKSEAYPLVAICVTPSLLSTTPSGIVPTHSGIVTSDSGIVTTDSGQDPKSARWTGVGGRDGPEWLGTIARIGGHDGPEYPRVKCLVPRWRKRVFL